MISIEQAENGYILRFDDDRVLVKQAEYNSMNLALVAALMEIIELYRDHDDQIKINLEASP
jgi:hypothetical protein